MADVTTNIDVKLNTGQASAEIRQLLSQLNAFNLSLSKANETHQKFLKRQSSDIKQFINDTTAFTASTVRMATAAEVLDKNLVKGKVSLNQFFSARFNKNGAMAAEVLSLATQRARVLETQFLATGKSVKGIQEAIAIRWKDQFIQPADIAIEKTKILSTMFRQGTTQLINFGKNVQWTGRQLMVGFTIPLTIFGNTAGKVFMDLEKQAVAFKKVYGDIFTTPAELDKNLEAVTGLAKEYTKYGVAVKDTIGLAAQAAAAGRKNADLTDAVTQATRLATLGQMDQNSALETTISLQSAFRLSGQELADTINFLNMVENQTVVSLQDLAAAIPRVAPVVQGLGGDVKDLAVFLAAMQEGGVDAAEGANALKSGLASLINPTKQATQMLSGMGINLDAIIQANKGDLMGTVMAFSQALAALDQFSRQQALEQVFGKFQYAKLGALFDNITRQGSQAQQVIETMGYSTEQLGATAEKELKTIEESFGVQLTAAMEKFRLAIAPIGEVFVKTAIPIINFLTKIAEKFNTLSDGQKQFAAIAAVILGIVIPAGTMLLGLLLNLTGTLLKLSHTFAVFSKGLITGGPLAAFRALTESAKYLSLSEMEAGIAAQQLAGSSEAVTIALRRQGVEAQQLQSHIMSLANSYGALYTRQMRASAIDQVGLFSTSAAASQVAGENFKESKGPRRKGFRGLRFNSGGTVPGFGNKDTVPALLTPGEAVINKQATEKYGPILQAMNEGSISGFTKGMVPGGSKSQLDEIFLDEIFAQAFEEARRNSPPGTVARLSENIRQFQEQVSSTESKISSTLDNGIDDKRVSDIKNRIDNLSQLTEEYKSLTSAKEINQKFAEVHLQKHAANVHKSAIATGDLARKIIEDSIVGRSGKLTQAQEALLYSEKLTDYRGGRLVGNFAIDAPRELNKGKVFIDDFIVSLKAMVKADINPYKKIFKSAGMTDPGLIEDASKKMHNITIGNLTAMKKAGVNFIDNKDIENLSGLYPSSRRKFLREFSKKKYGLTPEDLHGVFTRSKYYNISESGYRPGGNRAAMIAVNRKDIEAGRETSFILGGTPEGDKIGLDKNYSIPRKYSHLIEKEFKGIRLGGSNKITNISDAARLLTFVLRRGRKFATGGFVPGAGNSDTVPALLTPGEFVVNKEATKKNQQFLRSINDGTVQMYQEGGLVQGSDGRWRRPDGRFASKAEIQAHLSAGSTSRSRTMVGRFGMGLGRTALGLAGGTLGYELGGLPGSIAGGFLPEVLMKLLKNPVSNLASKMGLMSKVLAGTGVGSFVALGFEAYRLNKELKDAKDAGAKMTRALYGTADSAEKIAEAFGTTTYAQQALTASVEKVSGVIVTDEAKQASSGFMQSEAGKNILNDVIFARESGKQVEALKNQLSAAIISGAIGMEEANAIAIEVGNAIQDKTIAVSVAGELTQLLGPDGKDILKNISTIVTEISPEINPQKLQNDATKAYEDLSFRKKFGQIFAGGQENFERDYKIGEISDTNAAAFRNEANALGLLVAEYQNGNIGINDYMAKTSEIAKSSASNLDAIARSAGFSSYAELAKASAGTKVVVGTDLVTGAETTTTTYTEKQLQAQKIIEKQKEAYTQMLKDSGALPEVIDSIVASADKLGGTIYGDLISGKVSTTDLNILARWQGNLTPEELDKAKKDLQILNLIPDINKKFNFNSANAIEEMQKIIDGAAEIEKNPEIVKEFLAKDEYSDIFEDFSITYDTFANLDNIEKKLIMRNIEIYEKYEQQIKMANAGSPGEAARDRREILGPIAQGIQQGVFQSDVNSAVNDGNVQDGAGGGTDYKKNIQNRFDLVDKRLNFEAQKYQDIIKLNERQNELDERSISLNQRYLEQLSKQEDAINKSYETRISALNDVAVANERLKEQEQSRISLASALASGDIAGAASAISEMAAAKTANQIEDTRAALELQRETDLKNLKVEINGQLLTREQIQANIDSIEEQIYQRSILIQAQQDKIYEIEQQRLQNTREREKVETRLFLLEQRKSIIALQGKKATKGLSAEEKSDLQSYKNSYNEMAAYFNSMFGENIPQVKMFGGKIKKMAFGGIMYKGSNEPPPALKMAFGSVVPGMGNTDRVPALLTPGEFVIRKSVAQANMPLLEMLNNGMTGPSYTVPRSNFGVRETPIQQNTGIVYNDTYSINVNVSGTNASPDEIANVVVNKLSQFKSANVRGIRS